MTSFIENQHIVKRQRQHAKTPHLRSNNKSAGFNSEFMSQFRQKPQPQKKKKKASVSLLRKFADTGDRKEKSYFQPRFARSTRTKKTGNICSSIKLSVHSLATIAIIAVTVLIAFAVLNWEEISIKTPDLYTFHILENTNTEQHTIQYATTGISGLFSSVNMPENTDSGETIDQIPANENPQGMLITFEWQQYRVQRGDSVSGIAQKFKVSIGAIIASNNIQNARRLQEGSILKIPNVDGIPYQIKKDDSLSKIAASFNVPLEVILDVNDIKTDNIRPGETLFIPGARMNDIDLRRSLGEVFMYPLQGRFITSRYGMRKDPKNGVLQFHNGVDFRGNIGTTVMASLDGVVADVGQNWLYGKYIIITHGNGYQTLYGHLNSFNVKKGDRVARGRKIGEVGNTGYSTGPHLHFGIFDRNGKWVNPLELLN